MNRLRESISEIIDNYILCEQVIRMAIINEVESFTGLSMTFGDKQEIARLIYTHYSDKSLRMLIKVDVWNIVEKYYNYDVQD